MRNFLLGLAFGFLLSQVLAEEARGADTATWATSESTTSTTLPPDKDSDGIDVTNFYVQEPSCEEKLARCERRLKCTEDSLVTHGDIGGTTNMPFPPRSVDNR